MKINELQKYRNPDGFIVLDEIYDKLDKKREIQGTSDKEWLIFEDGMVLIKFARPNTYEAYAELLGEEAYRTFDIKAAQYDLISLNGKQGVLSVDIRKSDEVMLSGDIIITSYGKALSENNGGLETVEITPYFNTLIDIEEALKYSVAKQYRQDIISSLDWVFAVACLILDIDKHLRNWSILLSISSGKSSLAPQYDMSATGRFHLSIDRIKKFLNNYNRTHKQQYRERLITDDIFVNGYEKNATLRYSREKDDVIGICSFTDAYSKNPERFSPIAERLLKFDSTSVVESVEEKIKAPLPVECKEWFIAVCTTSIQILSNFLDDYKNKKDGGIKR